MPLHAEHKLIVPRVDDGFDYSIRGPRDRFEVAAYDIDGLVMVTVDRHVSRAGELGNQRVLGDVDRMRMTPKHIALHMLDRIFDFSLDVLNQRASAINIQRLNSKTDCQHGKPASFSSRKQHHIGFISLWNDRTHLRLWLAPVAERIDVVDRARK